MHTQRDLTPRQRGILDFIRSEIRDKQRPPTMREIGTHFDIKSPNGVHCHLKALVRKGYICMTPNTARAMFPTRGFLTPSVGTTEGHVSLDVGESVTRLTPDQARELARQLIDAANAA